MKISSEQVRKVLQSYVQQVDGKKSDKTGSSGHKAGDVKSKSDSVTITGGSEEARKAREAYDNLPDVRMDLVDDLKEKIKSGEYSVSSKDIADKIVHRAIVDKTV